MFYDKELLKDVEDIYIKSLEPELNKVKSSRGGIVPNYKGKTGRLHPTYGKKHPRRKPILQFDLQGNFIKEWEYIVQVKDFGFQYTNVSACCRGKSKFHKGYIWKYKDLDI